MSDTNDTASAATDANGGTDASDGEDARGFTEAEIAAASASARRLQAESRVKTHVMASMTLGLVPMPIFDLAALTGNQLAMLKGLCTIYDTDCNPKRTRALLLSLLAGTTPVAAVVGLSSGAKLIPGIGSLLGSGSVAVSAGALTYALGQVFIGHLEDGGDLLQPPIGELRERLRRELARGTEVAKGLKDEVVAKTAQARRWTWRKRTDAEASGPESEQAAAG